MLLFLFLLTAFILFFGCAGSLLLHAGFSVVAKSRGYSLVAVSGLLIVVVSRFTAGVLGMRASVAVTSGLSCPWHVGSAQIRDPTHVPCTGGLVLKVPLISFHSHSKIFTEIYFVLGPGGP